MPYSYLSFGGERTSADKLLLILFAQNLNNHKINNGINYERFMDLYEPVSHAHPSTIVTLIRRLQAKTDGMRRDETENNENKQ